MPTSSPDVVIIGAGIIGGSIAWRLAQSGLRVTMVDAKYPVRDVRLRSIFAHGKEIAPRRDPPLDG